LRWLVYLQGDEEPFTEGVSRRDHRCKPAASLRSQYDTVEERTIDENAIVISAPGAIVGTTLDLLNRWRPHKFGRALPVHRPPRPLPT
jgi:gluconate kinase